MSQESFEINADPRDDMGKGASRRLRRAGRVPGIIYGGKKEPVAISLEQNELRMHLDHEAFYSHILTLKLGGKNEQVILKDLQRHPYKQTVTSHVDFLRVLADQKLHVNVPLHFLGEDEAPGVKTGGVVSRLMNEVEVEVLPKDLPEYIEVDISAMEIGDSIHLSELSAPEGVTLVALTHDDDRGVVSLLAPRVEQAEDEEDAETDEAAAEGKSEADDDSGDADTGGDEESGDEES